MTVAQKWKKKRKTNQPPGQSEAITNFSAENPKNTKSQTGKENFEQSRPGKPCKAHNRLPAMAVSIAGLQS